MDVLGGGRIEHYPDQKVGCQQRPYGPAGDEKDEKHLVPARPVQTCSAHKPPMHEQHRNAPSSSLASGLLPFCRSSTSTATAGPLGLHPMRSLRPLCAGERTPKACKHGSFVLTVLLSAAPDSFCTVQCPWVGRGSLGLTDCLSRLSLQPCLDTLALCLHALTCRWFPMYGNESITTSYEGY